MGQENKVCVKDESEANPQYGCRPSERPIDEYIHKGFIVLDKPAGPTSHQAAAWVKDIFNLKKTGHSGTLDPKVTGVLPTALAESTKILQALFGADKQYICLMKLHGETSNNTLKKTLSDFQGVITQKPPVKSKVKRVERQRTIHSIKLLQRKDRYVLFLVDCEAGTYIRKLCHDIGQALNVGAHMRQLRRTKAGGFTEDETVTLHDVRDAWETYLESKDDRQIRQSVKPMEEMIRGLPKIWVKDSAVDALCHGAQLKLPGVSKLTGNVAPGEPVALMTLKDELIALAESQLPTQKILSEDKGQAASLKRVALKQGTYPKTW